MLPKVSRKQMRRTLFFRTNPGWRRVLSAALIAPLVTPIACLFVFSILDDDFWLYFDPILGSLLGVIVITMPYGYGATLLFGLPICLGLAHVGLAGIIPVIGVGLGFGSAIGYWWMPPDVPEIASIASGFTVSLVAWLIAYWGWWRH